jgi:hypothetical protein
MRAQMRLPGNAFSVTVNGRSTTEPRWLFARGEPEKRGNIGHRFYREVRRDTSKIHHSLKSPVCS